MSDLYTEGPVWRISFVKVSPGRTEQYIAEVGPLRKKMMEEAIKKGYILSHKTLNGLSMGPDDWDFMFMVEYKNWEAIDSMRTRMDEINELFSNTTEKTVELMENRAPLRELKGEKFMREIYFS